MAESITERNKQDNIDLLQVEYLSDLPTSTKDMIVVEPINPVAIMIRKFLVKMGFENIHLCEANDCVKIFSDFINKDINVPVIIDDVIPHVNIRNIIKEVFEIQINAKIIIITSKEKNSVQIAELLNSGVSSIIQKPLDFQNFKKSIETIIEKNDMAQKITSVENFVSITQYSNRISQNKIQDMLKIGTVEVTELIKRSLDNRNITLENEVLEAACNQCNSTNIMYVAECPNCSGINFKQQDLVEHYSCGEVFPKERNNDTCPKCNKKIGNVGTDYREFSDYHICSSCSDRFPKPLLRFRCLDCNNLFIEKLAIWKKDRIYLVQK